MICNWITVRYWWNGMDRNSRNAGSKTAAWYTTNPRPRFSVVRAWVIAPHILWLHCSGTILDINLIWHEIILRIIEHRLQFYILLSSITGNPERSEQLFTALWPYESSPLYAVNRSGCTPCCKCADVQISVFWLWYRVGMWRITVRQRCYFPLQISKWFSFRVQVPLMMKAAFNFLKGHCNSLAQCVTSYGDCNWTDIGFYTFFFLFLLPITGKIMIQI